MIKCDWYWRLLKLLFFGLLISFFTLFVGSSVKAGAFGVVWFDKTPSVINSQFKLWFLKWGWVITDYLATNKSILALDSDKIFWRTPDWRPYFYSPSSQWFFTKVFSCPEIIATWDSFQLDFPSCSWIPMSWLDYWPMFKNFFSHVVIWDYTYYDYYHLVWWNTCSYWYHTHIVCFSSHELETTLCFAVWSCYNWCQWWSNSCRSFCNWTICDWWVYESQDYQSLNFGNIPYWSIWSAPWQNWYMWDYEWSQGDWSYWNIDWFITGSVFQQECTVWYAKNYAENLWLSSYLCYWWLPLDSDWLAVAVAWTGANVFEIFNASNDWKNFQSWFQYRNNIFVNRYVYNQSVWSWTPAPLYSYFNFVSQYWPTFTSKEIQDYCRIIINNMDLNSSWHGTSSWCPQLYWWWGGWSSSDNSYREDDTWTWVIGWSTTNNLNISVNWDWVWTHSWNEVKTPSAYIQDFFNKAREVIPTNFSDIWGWFLPTYIITFLLAIILFRFLRH